jgi:hypothetical protein
MTQSSGSLRRMCLTVRILRISFDSYTGREFRSGPPQLCTAGTDTDAASQVSL